MSRIVVLGRLARFSRRIAPLVSIGALLALSLILVVVGAHGAQAGEASSTGTPARGGATSAPSAIAVYPEGARTDGLASKAGPAIGTNGSSPHHVVIQMASGKTLPDLSALGLRDAEPVGRRGAYVLELESGTGDVATATMLEEVRNLSGVLRVEQGALRSACLVPNDPFYSSSSPSHGQWSLPRIGMPAAWDVETGSSDVVVAILDTGIDKDLPDFAGRIVSPYSAIDQRTDWPYWRDNSGHGTAVAGVAVAQGNDNLGMAGVAWDVKIMPVKIADHGNTYDYTLADGIYWAVDHGADVINVSFAGDVATGVEKDAVQYALDRDVIVVAAAGNKAWKGIYFPAALPGVIAVGATEESPANPRAFFSATGPELDVVAPGTDIWSYTVGASSWAWWSGTSFAAPIVTGVSALLRSLDPMITSAEVTDVLRQSADDLGPAGWDQEFGWGIVDADEAVTRAQDGTTTTTTPSSTTTSTAPPSTTTTTTLSRFADISADTPYAAQINRLAGLGIVEGGGDGLFRPLDNLRRQQFAKMIVLALGYPVSEADTNPFTDVAHIPGELYPYHYVSVAYRRGITKGTTPGHFSPYGLLTRAQMITMVTRAAQVPEPPAGYVPPFPSFSAVHYPFARKAAAAGLLDGILGIGPGYDFLAPASRGEACALLAGLLD